MPESASDAAYRRFLPWRRTFEIGFWVLLIGINWNEELDGEEIEPLDLLEEFEAEMGD